MLLKPLADRSNKGESRLVDSNVRVHQRHLYSKYVNLLVWDCVPVRLHSFYSAKRNMLSIENKAQIFVVAICIGMHDIAKKREMIVSYATHLTFHVTKKLCFANYQHVFNAAAKDRNCVRT